MGGGDFWYFEDLSFYMACTIQTCVVGKAYSKSWMRTRVKYFLPISQFEARKFGGKNLKTIFCMERNKKTNEEKNLSKISAACCQ